MKRIWAVAMVVLLWTAPVRAADLMVFSGAGLMKPMEEMRKNFERQHGVTVDVHYGSSGEIFGMIAAGQPCDVLIPGAEKYTLDALDNGWVEKETIRKLVLHLPAIAVPKGNPANVKGLDDLARQGVRVSIGDPKAPAIGRVSKKLLTKAKLWERVQPNIEVYAPTVNQLLIYVALNQVDAALIWKDLTSWAEAKGKIEVVDIDPGRNIIKTIPTAVCTRTKNRALALEFNNYVASADGLAIWGKWGFEPCAK
ncbi:molybdenum ABC transporter substrate-binding protein [Desulfosarcina ovata subsp. sediminis]|uniref:Molybdenum ABC transporter substrate-binding protein n=1 Tax=Desulfosarcina ovata subsp. sediminis TaxID=885957 RepID=A0A5K7ZZU5_9BACT|nr:molybdate ABC transporter substrate-binding protein [Desulfosarcina ovata]BBO85686.1 molybdenum ABC transporter substrate-binding protein [Desulfosarcina ovata subsp. sediminis]